MTTEFVVISPASSGVGAFKAHYSTIEAARRAAFRLLDDGSLLVWIADGDGNTIIREDEFGPLMESFREAARLALIEQPTP